MTAKELHDKIMSSSYEDGLKAIQQYAAEVSRELQEPIENALYATGKFTTDECMELTEGIIQYVKEQEEQQ